MNPPVAPVAPINLIGEPLGLMRTIKEQALVAIIEQTAPSLLTPSNGFRPFRYPWAYDLWKKHEQVHWMAEEVPMGDDVLDWTTKLNSKQRNLLTQVFRLFVKSDQVVADNYMDRLGVVFKPSEVRMMLSGFGARENLHVDAYALLLETVGMPAAEYEAFAEYEAMKAKVDYWAGFNVETPEDILRTLVMFGGFAEGVQVFSSFAMLMNFPRMNLMKGMGQIVSWSVRDESLHCEGIIGLYHVFARESQALTPTLVSEFRDMGRVVVEQEHKYVDLAFEQGGIEGMEPGDVKKYIEFIMDWRLRQMNLPELFGHYTEHPLPWLQSLLSGVEHANFFEARATSYSKGASRGDYGGVWKRFDEVKAPL